MYSLKVENNRGDMLDFSTTSDYIVYKIEGLNPPQATVNSSVNTTTDGSNVNSVRVESRNIVIYAKIRGNVEKSRIALYKYFPVKKSVTLYFRNGTRNVCISGVVELIECDLFENGQTAQISLICSKPYFKAVNELITSFSNVHSLFTFPFSIPKEGVEFSRIVTNTQKIIVNNGDVESGCIIKLFSMGEVVNPVIYDIEKQISFGINITMQAKDTIIINTNVGEKGITLIRGGVSSNILGYMMRGSSWLVLDSGDNAFGYRCDSGGNALQITFTTDILYSGV